MKYLLLLLLFVSVSVRGQMTFQRAQDSLQQNHLGFSYYFDAFKDHKGYGYGIILTTDGGAAGFGDGDHGTELIKLDKTGKVQWRKKIKKLFENQEPQCVAQDNLGNFYVFMLVYNPAGYRGGSERVVCFSKTGVLLWEKMLGPYTLLNNPTVSYVHMTSDGRIEMRGHVVKEKPEADKDPKYHYWQGWLNAKGVYTQKVGDYLDWSNEDWKKKFQPED